MVHIGDAFVFYEKAQPLQATTIRMTIYFCNCKAIPMVQWNNRHGSGSTDHLSPSWQVLLGVLTAFTSEEANFQLYQVHNFLIAKERSNDVKAHKLMLNRLCEPVRGELASS